MLCASNVGIKQGGRFPENLFITFQTLDRLVVDVRDVQNCRQEDDFASSITLRAFALHRLKIIISRKSHVGFILLKACFLFLTAMSHCLFHHGTAILIDLLDRGINSRAASRTLVSKRH